MAEVPKDGEAVVVFNELDPDYPLIQLSNGCIQDGYLWCYRYVGEKKSTSRTEYTLWRNWMTVDEFKKHRCD